MKIKFCGAATSVTGSCHLISTEDVSVLLDCGQFQGGKAIEELNYEPFPFEPASIQAVVLSHAHIDHCGRLPLLVKRGFRGKIYCTSATADLLEIMLLDSAHIHEKEAEWKNRKGERAGRAPVEPLYTTQDAIEALKYVVPILYDTLFEVNDSMKAVFNDAGHILGSAIVELWVTEGETTSKLVFSGDLGMKNRPILKDPKIIKSADYLIMEATYGNRVHEENAVSINRLVDIILKTTERGGNVVIPAFAVGRTQEMIFELNKIYDTPGTYKDRLKDVHVYVDSPMASAATEVFKKNAQAYDDEMKNFILSGDHPLDFTNLHFTRTTEESVMINVDRNPKVIISASGMCDAGRIRHHLKHNLWRVKSSIVFVGYQAEGTLGKILLDGAKVVTLFGEDISVQAEIHNLQGFSGHADRDGLLEWLSGFRNKPREIFLVHGEEDAKISFAKTVKKELGWDSTVVTGYDECDLSTGHKHSVGVHADPEAEFVSEDQVRDVRRRLAEVHNALETILYGTNLVMGSQIGEGRMVEIKNSLGSLEKAAMDMGSTITGKERSESDELPLEGDAEEVALRLAKK